MRVRVDSKKRRDKYVNSRLRMYYQWRERSIKGWLGNEAVR